MDLYREIILDHYRNPRGWGTLDNPTAEADGHNQLCGDSLCFQIITEGDIVKKIAFTGHGCAISLATASMLTETIIGKTLDELKELSRRDIEALLGTALPPARLKCGLLSLETIQLACTKISPK